MYSHQNLSSDYLDREHVRMHEVIFRTPYEEQLHPQRESAGDGALQRDASRSGELLPAAEPGGAGAPLAHSREWNAARPSDENDASKPNSFTLARSGRLYKGPARHPAARASATASELEGLMESMQAQAQAHIGAVHAA